MGPEPGHLAHDVPEAPGLARATTRSRASAVDRYKVDGKLTPVLVGVRQINVGRPAVPYLGQHPPAVHPRRGHGHRQIQPGSVERQPCLRSPRRPARSRATACPTSSSPTSTSGSTTRATWWPNTKQAEFDAQLSDGPTIQSHYKGSGGVQLSSFLAQAAFAVATRATSTCSSRARSRTKSRIMFVRDIQQMAQKAAPFLSFDADPYAVLVNGHIDWVLDGYTTTASTRTRRTPTRPRCPGGSNLPGSYNYVRNSVKLVIDAYSGKMTFYALGNDPILRSYEAAFPHMFTPISRDELDAPEPPALPRGHVLDPGGHVRPLPRALAVDLLHTERGLEPLADLGRRLAGQRARRSPSLRTRRGRR